MPYAVLGIFGLLIDPPNVAIFLVFGRGLQSEIAS
jgi:hypothetical protein